jgi:hypothetical protein
MRRPWLIIGLVLSLNACSNATFKGVKGDTSRDETPPVKDEEANPNPPPTGSPNKPPTDDPNTQNPTPDPGPCDVLTLLDLTSLYQLQNDVCNPGDPNDDPEDPDDDPEDPDDDPDDDPGQNDDDPAQNDPGQNS